MIERIHRFLKNLFITYLNISHKHLTSLPENLPSNLQSLWCYDNQLTSLPENLPQSLETISCYNNQLTSLPDNLPKSLETINCDNNQLTSLPENLPKNLKEIYCYCNQLTSLPEKLPPNLHLLKCGNNKISTFPNNLPQHLQIFCCINNQLTILPDLPSSLFLICLYGNPLEINYPKIYTFEIYLHYSIFTYYYYKNPQEVIAYVNECNSQRRTQTRARAIARELAEVYCRQALHPSRLAYLLDNPEEDPNDFMDKLSSNI